LQGKARQGDAICLYRWLQEETVEQAEVNARWKPHRNSQNLSEESRVCEFRLSLPLALQPKAHNRTYGCVCPVFWIWIIPLRKNYK